MGRLKGVRMVEFGALGPGPMAAMLLADMDATDLRLERPQARGLDLARGMGVAGKRVEKADEICAAVAAAFAGGKPAVIEIAIEGKR